MNIETLVFTGGIFHFGILIASALVPQVLDWKESLNKLDGLLRQLIWVHGAFIVLVIIGFGLISILFPGELASGTPLAKGVCAFIVIFWGARLLVQLFIFDATPFLKTTFLKIGYHSLTVVFAYHVIVYSIAGFGIKI